MKPFPFDDFSGGITDKDVPGPQNRYSICDNLLIDHAKKPIQRDGFDIFSSTAYQLTASERVARIHSFDNESELLAFQHTKAYAVTAGAWAEVTGPAAGHAFNSASASHLVEASEWQHHLFAASNVGDPPIKMYRDSGGTMRLRSAGLPEWPTTIQSDNDGGLARAILLANDLRTVMTTHYQANGATTGASNNLTNGHHSSNAALTAQASAVSGSTVASSLATLITLLNLLRTQYNSHISDAQKEDPGRSGFTFPAFRSYHAAPASGGEAFYIYYDPTTTFNQPVFQWRHYLNLSLADPNYTIPSTATIASCLPYLNDLRDKWNWHTMATNTHFNAIKWKGNVRTKYGTHKTALARVETYTWANIAPNLGPLKQFLADLLVEYNSHIADTNSHLTLADTTNVVDASFPTSPADLWECVCLLGGLADSFTYHAMEADPLFGPNGAASAFYTVAATVASGAPTMSIAVGGTLDQYKYYNAIPIVGDGASPYAWSIGDAAFTVHSNYKATGSTNATPAVVTFPTNFAAARTSKQFVLTTMQQHWGLHPSTLFSPREFALSMNTKDYTIGSAASLQGIADLAELLAGYLKAHTLSQMVQVVPNGSAVISKIAINNNQFDVYTEKNSLQALGYNVAVHYYQDQTNYPNTVIFPQRPMFANVSWVQSRFDTAPQAVSFNYQAAFRYDYTVGTKSFTDRSAPSASINVIGFLNEDSSPDGSTETGKYAAVLSNVYAFANASNENWAISDTTNFRKEIYRTLGNSTDGFFRVDIDGAAGDMSNATTSFSDYTTDTWIADQLALYTNSGAPENNRPPAATGLHVFDNRAFYVLGNRVYQSIPNDPDSVPGDFYEEFPENIMGVSSTKTVAVAFGRNAVYRLVGGFDDLGRGALTYERIFNRTGAVSSQSIVKADEGIFFAGKDGFYFTDGYQCMRVTDLEDTFRGYTDTAAKLLAIHGTYDQITKRVYYTLITTGGSNPDKLWVLDLKFGIKPEITPVTTISKTTGWNPTALTFHLGILHYGDADGYIFKATRGRNIDLVKNTSTAATLWPAETVQWDWKSCHHDYGSGVIRKYFTRITCQFEQQSTNVSAQIYSDADKGRIISTLPVIRSRKLTDWGDSKIDWVSGVYTAKAGSLVDSFRWMKGDGSLRSNFRAFEFKNAYCVIVASKDMGTVTLALVSGNDWTVTLTSLVATRKWPLYSVGYFVRIGGVDYPVSTRTSDSVVHIDATGLAIPTAGVPVSWELWGYPKNERIRFLGYTVNVDVGDDNESMSEGPVKTGGQNP